ncbi:MAG: hypothetical protein M3541_20045 [Acidobacteriota bacterium]|nr:hypothetical protein [Acidobacteriota bacterium]MDQ3421032.1 hypothetical protein [Acidobacteriota bacterium]
MEKARLALVGLAVTLLTGCAGPSVNTATYASFAEARSAGAVEKGLVPAMLPPSAYELRAAYATDGSERWGLFNFREADAVALRSILQPDEISFAGTEMTIPGRIEWWPVILRGTLDAERIQATGLRAYPARTAGLVFAVNWSQGRAYYWTH